MTRSSSTYKMARVTTTCLVSCFTLLQFTLTFAQLDTSNNKNGPVNPQNNGGNGIKPSLNQVNNENNNNSLGGFSPITRFYPSLTYSSNPNPNSNNYYGNQNLNHHYGQGYYPRDHNHQHPYAGYPPQNYLPGNQGSEKGFNYQYPLPIGYYPPTFGTSTTTKPFPSTSPYPIPTIPYGGSTRGYPFPTPTPHNGYGPVQNYPGSHYDGFDVGSLPQQVRVPGEIRISIDGKDAAITCEFPKYLILIQVCELTHFRAGVSYTNTLPIAQYFNVFSTI